MSSSPFTSLSQRWRAEEPQSFIILTLTLSILFLTPWGGCNPQRNHQEYNAIKQSQLQEERVLARPRPKALSPKTTSPQQQQPPHH